MFSFLLFAFLPFFITYWANLLRACNIPCFSLLSTCLHFSHLLCFLSVMLFYCLAHFLKACSIACFPCFLCYRMHTFPFLKITVLAFSNLVSFFSSLSSSLQYCLISLSLMYSFTFSYLYYVSYFLHLFNVWNIARFPCYCLHSCTFSHLQCFRGGAFSLHRSLT